MSISIFEVIMAIFIVYIIKKLLFREKVVVKPKKEILNKCIRLTDTKSDEFPFKRFLRSLQINEGTMHDHTKVTVRNVNFCQEYQLMFANSLEEHPNFITQYFMTKDNLGQNYIIEEYYEGVLKSWTVETKQVFLQLSSALEFSKSLGIIIGSIKTTNVAVFWRYSEVRYKITDFSSSFKAKNYEEFKIDIEELGKLLNECRNENLDHEGKNWLMSPCDDIMFLDLLDSMVNRDAEDCPTIEEIRKHPFPYDSEKKLNLFVKAAKILESPNSTSSVLLNCYLNYDFEEIISEDWINYIDKRMKNELNRIRKKKNKKFFDAAKNNIVDLIKTIRNLHVHLKTDEIIKLIGESDDDLCEYWTKYFPELVLHVFYALEEIDEVQIFYS